jgi:hypothetical protein
LYGLEPGGLGTPYVESLTGYVARLAEAHCVLARSLVVYEIVPLFGRPYLMDEQGSYIHSFFRTHASAVNGTQSLAEEWVRIIEELTCRKDIRFMTMLPWADVLPWKGLLKRKRHWCPMCYEHWLENGDVIYEPLLWSIEIVKVCPIHKQTLESVCPYPDCGKSQPPLGSRSRPGHCAVCTRWLGRKAEPSNGMSPPDEDLQWHLLVANAVGELLAASPSLAEPPRSDRVPQAIEAFRRLLGYSNVRAMSLRIGCNYTTMRGWVLQGNLPTLEQLVRMCHALNTTPLRFLTRVPLALIRSDGGAEAVVKAPKRKGRGRNRKVDQDKLRRELELALSDATYPPLSMREVGRRLGYETNHGYLLRYFPELSKAISERYMAYIQGRKQDKEQSIIQQITEATLNINDDGEYPSYPKVAARLSSPGWMRHPFARRAWHDVLRELGWEK